METVDDLLNLLKFNIIRKDKAMFSVLFFNIIGHKFIKQKETQNS